MQGFKDIPRVVWLLAAGVFVNAVVSFTFVFVFLYLTGPRGLGAAQAGLVTGIGGIGLVAGNFSGGWYGDRFGHRRVLLAAATLAGATLAALPLLPAPLLFAALPVAQYASGVIRAANSALVAVTVPEGGRRQAFALVRCASNGGFTLGPPLGALVATGLSYDWLFVADGVGTLAFAIWTARVVPARGAPRKASAAPDGGQGRGLLAELRARPALLVLLGAILVTDVVYRQQYSTFPVFLTDHGLDPRAFGLVIALNGAVILLLELPAAVALRDRPALPVIAAGLVLVGAGYGALLFGAGVASAVVMMVLLSLGEILYKTTATAYVADEAPEHAVGRFQSLYAGISVSGVVLGPPLGGALYSAAPGLLWPLCAGLATAAGGAVLWAWARQRRRASRHAIGPAHETGSRPRAVAG
ncbi:MULTISPECIES: MFS transporter [unclassified Streptomyces]|uniref:MFS transporter n=1 Tax=Streptomyces sp. TN58 TaxID=234612 RepID=UPI00061F578F|nr:MFS transporter [Streptomyces sp. TN58]APU44265.1 MFS transporter [Streptomyces sp. TN58]KJK52545.1 multidrug transporter [Streptomyces sp. NRRL F-4428]